ncbi:MAG: hypothetical protein WCO50_05820 [Synechococcus sp. ELA619]
MNQPGAWIPGSGRLIASAAQGLRRAWGLGLGLMLPLVLALAVMLSFAGLQPQSAWAGPVEWQEVPATEAGRQWWDRGSLRLSKQGTLTVLSRFQAAAEPDPAGSTLAEPAPAPATNPGASAVPAPGNTQGLEEPGSTQQRRPRQPNSELYVSEIDCDQALMRDTSINGIPQWRASWQPVAGDGLMEAVVQAVCEAGGQLLASR